MKTEGTIRIPVRRTAPILQVMVATGVALIALGAAYVTRGLSSAEAPPARETVERTAPGVEDWGFVLRADAAQVLRHRPGLEPVDLVRTHAFGWEGLTLGEVLASPVLVRELRLQPQLSPIDLIRMEARGS